MRYFIDDYGAVYCMDEKRNYFVYDYKLKKFVSPEGFHLDPESWVEVTKEEAERFMNK